jgi:hypothetical protein
MRDEAGVPAGTRAGGCIVAVCRSASHGLAKHPCPDIRLLAGLGVEADAHCGHLVKHRYLAARDPGRPNLRQIHLIQAELQDELTAAGFAVGPRELGFGLITSSTLPL